MVATAQKAQAPGAGGTIRRAGRRDEPLLGSQCTNHGYLSRNYSVLVAPLLLIVLLFFTANLNAVLCW